MGDGPCRILIVEDDAAHVELIRRAFARRGAGEDLAAAGTLAEARAYLAASHPHLVIADLVLPDGVGTDLLSGPGADAAYPLMVMTAHGDEEVAVDAMKAGAIDYLVKSDVAFADMPRLADRALRQWRHITDRKRIEEELRQAQKMEAVGRMAGGIAHDFNNQLTVILGYANRLKKQFADDEEAARMAGEVVAAAERSADLTRQLLAFGRRQLLQPKVVDLNAVLATLANPLQSMIGEDIRLTTVLGPDLGNVLVDPAQVQHAVINLAANARDAMPKGGQFTIETAGADLDEAYVRQHANATAGPHVCITVTDTGCGMDAETLARVFEPFFTTKPPGEGTGLGLSMVYGFVRQSGGHVTVESEPGAGTTFRIYLPVAGEDKQRAASAEGPQPAAVPRGESQTVLVVEDDAAVRRLMVRVLELDGYKTIEAASSDEALDMLRSGSVRVHLLVSDVVMPGMNGLELARQARAACPGLPILFVTGYAEGVLVARGDLAPGEALLTKPFDPESLAGAVRRLLPQ